MPPSAGRRFEYILDFLFSCFTHHEYLKCIPKKETKIFIGTEQCYSLVSTLWSLSCVPWLSLIVHLLHPMDSISLSLSLWRWIFIWDQVHVQVENLHKPASIYKRTVAYFIWWWILIFQTKSNAINKIFIFLNLYSFGINKVFNIFI